MIEWSWALYILSFLPCFLFTVYKRESQDQLSWKRPVRSNPASGQTPLCQLDHGSKCHIQPFLKTVRDSDSATSLGSPLQYLITLPVKKFFLKATNLKVYGVFIIISSRIQFRWVWHILSISSSVPILIFVLVNTCNSKEKLSILQRRVDNQFFKGRVDTGSISFLSCVSTQIVWLFSKADCETDLLTLPSLFFI